MKKTLCSQKSLSASLCLSFQICRAGGKLAYLTGVCWTWPAVSAQPQQPHSTHLGARPGFRFWLWCYYLCDLGASDFRWDHLTRHLNLGVYIRFSFYDTHRSSKDWFSCPHIGTSWHSGFPKVSYLTSCCSSRKRIPAGSVLYLWALHGYQSYLKASPVALDTIVSATELSLLCFYTQLLLVLPTYLTRAFVTKHQSCL